MHNLFPARIARRACLLVTILFALFIVQSLSAHNPLIATHFLLKHPQPDGSVRWTLSMHLTLGALDAALQKKYGAEYLELPEDERNRVRKEYIKDSIAITSLQGGSPVIGDPTMRLDGHHSAIDFVLQNMPADASMLQVRISLCKENEQHANLLRLVLPEQEKRYWMRASNDYQVRVRIAGISRHLYLAWGLGFICFVAGISGFACRRQRL